MQTMKQVDYCATTSIVDRITSTMDDNNVTCAEQYNNCNRQVRLKWYVLSIVYPNQQHMKETVCSSESNRSSLSVDRYIKLCLNARERVT